MPFRDGWLTLFIKVGEQEHVLTALDYRTQKQLPRSLQFDFDGKIAIVRLDRKVLHSFVVDWDSTEDVRFTIDEGQVFLSDFSLLGLREP